MTYAGLTTADKPALLDAQKFGARWIARDWNNCIYGYYNRPNKTDTRVWSWTGLMHEMNEESLEFVKWDDPEPVNIDIAIAQIAEMESAEKMDGCEYCAANGTIWSRFTSVCYRQDGEKRFDEREVNVKFCPNCGKNLASPYMEGATK